MRPADVAAIVLAAGAGSRFGGGKLLAALEGRPILHHVLDTLSECALLEIVVVVGDDAAAIEDSLAGSGEGPRGRQRLLPNERLVRNERPADGLASSLWTGIEALSQRARAALIVLGDQPRLRGEVVSALVESADGSNVAIVPRYAQGGDPNPVLLLRAGWALVSRTSGDRGLAPILAAHPGLVRHIVVPGSNPDVDTVEDLARLEKLDTRQALDRHGSRSGTLR